MDSSGDGTAMPPDRPARRGPASGRSGSGGGPGRSPDDGPEVGEFRQGSPLSQWALARYLVGRAIAESVGRSLLIVAGVLLVLAVVAEWVVGSTLLSVLLVLVAVGTLVLRAALLAIVRRLTGERGLGPLGLRLSALVDDTRGDVLRELRRIGLPGHTVTLPLLALRLVRARRRGDTLARLRRFDTARAVPAGRIDELHLLLQTGPEGPLR